MRREYSYFSRTVGHEQGCALALSEGLASHKKLNVFRILVGRCRLLPVSGQDSLRTEFKYRPPRHTT